MNDYFMLLIKYVHVLAVIYFVGPGLFMLVALSPAIRNAKPEELGPVMKILSPAFVKWRKLLGMYLIPVVYLAGFLMFWLRYGFGIMHAHVTLAILVLIPYFWMTSLMRKSEGLKKEGKMQEAAPLDHKAYQLSVLIFIIGWFIVFLAILKL